LPAKEGYSLPVKSWLTAYRFAGGCSFYDPTRITAIPFPAVSADTSGTSKWCLLPSRLRAGAAPKQIAEDFS